LNMWFLFETKNETVMNRCVCVCRSVGHYFLKDNVLLTNDE